FSQRELRYQLLDRRLRAAEKALEGLREDLRPALAEHFRKRVRADYDAETQKLQLDLNTLVRQEAGLRGEVEALKADVDKFGKSSAELDQLAEDIANGEALVKEMESRYQRMQLDVGNAARVSIYQPAALQYKDNKRQIFAAIAAGLAGL